MTTPHKLAEFLHAFADGKVIEFKHGHLGWTKATNLETIVEYAHEEWRIKPNTILINGEEVPHIGDEWPEHQGIYAGIARGIGEPDAHLVLLHELPRKERNWDVAMAWAESLGNGAHVPTRFESALLYANVRDKFQTDGWYWTGAQYSDDYAFYQDFEHSWQDTSRKTNEARVRAVRRITIKETP